MIFQRATDSGYRRWFAWYPVRLRGPDEWTRRKITGKPNRLVWLSFVWRMRFDVGIYYTVDA